MELEEFDKSIGIVLHPFGSLQEYRSDALFLQSLLIKEEAKKEIATKPLISQSKPVVQVQNDSTNQDLKLVIDSSYFESSSPEHVFFNTNPSNCLTQEDIDFMLMQRQRFKDFEWNNNVLCFTQTSDYYWYNFSVPVFSVDSNTVIMGIEITCPGFCGTGWTSVYQNVNDQWQVKRTNQHIH